MTDRVFVAIWTHRHGMDVSAFKTKEGAENWRQEIAKDNWDDEMRGLDSPPERPENPADLADRYFEIMADRFGNGEFFDVKECPIEG